MDRDQLLPVVPEQTSLRATARELVPFEVRLGVRRIPAIASWLTRPRPSRGTLEHVITARSSPLRRPGTTYDPATQQGKEHNVRRVAAAIDGVLIGPGARFSWNDTVGPPLARRGFVNGPELHDGKLAMGMGGGACQVANLVFWLAATGGLQIPERHRHRWDLFPDSQRDVPFGCGATVFWPHRDLVLHNPHPVSVVLSMQVRDGLLHGALHSASPLDSTWTLVETAHRFVEHRGRIWRLNTISRDQHGPDGASRSVLVHNKALVAYPVDRDALWRG